MFRDLLQLIIQAGHHSIYLFSSQPYSFPDYLPFWAAKPSSENKTTKEPRYQDQATTTKPFSAPNEHFPFQKATKTVGFPKHTPMTPALPTPPQFPQISLTQRHLHHHFPARLSNSHKVRNTYNVHVIGNNWTWGRREISRGCVCTVLDL